MGCEPRTLQLQCTHLTTVLHTPEGCTVAPQVSQGPSVWHTVGTWGEQLTGNKASGLGVASTSLAPSTRRRRSHIRGRSRMGGVRGAAPPQNPGPLSLHLPSALMARGQRPADQRTAGQAMCAPAHAEGSFQVPPCISKSF